MMLKKNREKNLIILFAIIFSFFNIYTYMVEKFEYFNSIDYGILIFNIFILTIITYFGVQKVIKLFYSKKIARVGEKYAGSLNDFQYFFIVTLLQFLLWVPIFLAYYPGLFTYDAIYQIPLGKYSTKHPLLHTLYLQFFYYIIGEKMFESHNAGIACATLMQMGIFSMMLSYTHLYLRRVKIAYKIRFTLITITSIIPIFPMMALSTTKDIFFSGFVGMFITSICYEQLLPKQSSTLQNKIICVISVAGTILFRNNGIYPIIAVCIAIIFVSVKKKKYNFIALVIGGVCIGILISFSLRIGLHATKGSLNETLSLPYQQLACAYRDYSGNMSAEEKAQIIAMIPNIENYIPHLSDEIKNTASGGDNLYKFIQLYFRIAVKYPKSYIKAFCKLNAGYLCLADTTFANMYGSDDLKGIFPSGISPGADIERISLSPWIKNLYEELYKFNKYSYVFGLNLLCSPALYFWIIFSMLGYAIIQHKSETIVLFVFIYTLLATILAGPCCLIRYALPYIVCIPQLMSVVLDTKRRQIHG